MQNDSRRVARWIREHGGAVPLRRLDAAGLSRERLRSAVADGVIVRVNRGWYAVPDAPHDVVRAVRVGGAATAGSVARIHGLWAEDDGVLHVRVPRTASRLKSPAAPIALGAPAARAIPKAVPILPLTTSASNAASDTAAASDAASGAAATAAAAAAARLDPKRDRVCVHYRSQPALQSGRDPLALALAEMMRCAEADHAITTIDSALARGEVDLAELRAFASAANQKILARTAAGSESGTETKVRLLLRSRNIRHRTQVPIPRVGRVDLLVGDRLVIEVDGSRFHSGPEEFENDRRRDFELAMLGYLVLRLSYSMVVDEWKVTSRGILALIARGEHRWGTRTARSDGLDTALRRLDAYDDEPLSARFDGR